MGCGSSAPSAPLYVAPVKDTGASPDVTPIVESKEESKAVVPKSVIRSTFDVFVGTQTGTATEYALKIESHIRECGGGVIMTDLSNFDPVLNSSSHLTPEAKLVTKTNPIIVVTSTYGDGDPPENSLRFSRWISREAPPQCLLGRRHCVYFYFRPLNAPGSCSGLQIKGEIPRIWPPC